MKESEKGTLITWLLCRSGKSFKNTKFLSCNQYFAHKPNTYQLCRQVCRLIDVGYSFPPSFPTEKRKVEYISRYMQNISTDASSERPENRYIGQYPHPDSRCLYYLRVFSVSHSSWKVHTPIISKVSMHYNLCSIGLGKQITRTCKLC